MRRATVPLLFMIAACLALPVSAAAHELVVLPVGGGTIDAGTADPARLIHATLDAPADELVVTARSTGTPLELLLLVPDRRPERSHRGADRPSLQVRGDLEVVQDGSGDPGPDPDVDAAGDELVDEGTAIAYRLVDAATLAGRAGEAVTITITRGAAPTRVALRVGPATSFEAADVERTPRTLARARTWVESPPPSATVTRGPARTASRPFVALYGAGIAVLGVLLGTWWVWRGRRSSRERGAERAAIERDAAGRRES